MVLIMNKINYIVIDIDGTLTDGKILVTSNGEEILNFSVYDGNAIVNVENFQKKIIILSGRKSKASLNRMKNLRLKNIHLGIPNKLSFLKSIINDKELKNNTLVIGDDYPDLEIFNFCKYKACPANAVKEIKNLSQFISSLNGGNGAVREILNYFNLFKKNQ